MLWKIRIEAASRWFQLQFPPVCGRRIFAFACKTLKLSMHKFANDISNRTHTHRTTISSRMAAYLVTMADTSVEVCLGETGLEDRDLYNIGTPFDVRHPWLGQLQDWWSGLLFVFCTDNQGTRIITLRVTHGSTSEFGRTIRATAFWSKSVKSFV